MILNPITDFHMFSGTGSGDRLFDQIRDDLVRLNEEMPRRLRIAYVHVDHSILVSRHHASPQCARPVKRAVGVGVGISPGDVVLEL